MCELEVSQADTILSALKGALVAERRTHGCTHTGKQNRTESLESSVSFGSSTQRKRTRLLRRCRSQGAMRIPQLGSSGAGCGRFGGYPPSGRKEGGRMSDSKISHGLARGGEEGKCCALFLQPSLRYPRLLQNPCLLAYIVCHGIVVCTVRANFKQKRAGAVRCRNSLPLKRPAHRALCHLIKRGQTVIVARCGGTLHIPLPRTILLHRDEPKRSFHHHGLVVRSAERVESHIGHLERWRGW